jgi:ankyrin repeat protein
MHCAAFYGHKRIVILLKQYGFSVNIKNKYGNLPIEEAANK